MREKVHSQFLLVSELYTLDLDRKHRGRRRCVLIINSRHVALIE